MLMQHQDASRGQPLHVCAGNATTETVDPNTWVLMKAVVISHIVGCWARSRGRGCRGGHDALALGVPS